MEADGENTVQGIVNGFAAMLKTLEEGAKGLTDTIIDHFVSVFKIENNVSGLTKEFGEILVTGLYTGIENKIADATSTVQTLIDRLKETIETGFGISGSESSVFREYGTAMGNGLINAINSIAGSVSGAFNNAFNSVMGALNSFSSSFMSGLNSLVSQAQGAFNSLMSMQNQMSSMQFNSYSYNIPRFAEGGTVYGPTLAVVGDNPNAASDPEIIAPLSKLGAVFAASLPKTLVPESYAAALAEKGARQSRGLNDSSIAKIINGISENFAMALASAAGSSGGGDNRPITLEIDGVQIARVLNPYSQAENRRLGVQAT
jgi:hypothetical protein